MTAKKAQHPITRIINDSSSDEDDDFEKYLELKRKLQDKKLSARGTQRGGSNSLHS